MIVINNKTEECQTEWQPGFEAILPEIQEWLRRAFRHLDPDSRDDATEDGVLHVLFAYIRLFEQCRTAVASPSNLAWYATRQVRRGRQAGCRLNSREPLSRYAQIAQGIQVERRQDWGGPDGNWIDSIVADRRSSVPEQVAARLDIAAWFATLPTRLAAIAKDLAYGYSTAETARKFRVTTSRISQLRRELERSWTEFQSENTSLASH